MRNFLFCWLSFIYKRHSTFCHKNCIYYMPYWCYIYKNFCPSKIRLTWSYSFSVNPILTQQACRWTNRAFGILHPNNYSPGSKITTWLVSEIESTFKAEDLGLTCNTEPYRTNSWPCGWHWPIRVRIWCHLNTLTRDCITIDTMREDWCYKIR